MSLSWIAAQPRMLDPSMPKPSSKLVEVELADGVGDVVLQARDIGKPQIELPRLVLFRKIQILPADSYILLVSQP